MRSRRVILSIALAGVLVFGCACGKEEKKSSESSVAGSVQETQENSSSEGTDTSSVQESGQKEETTSEQESGQKESTASEQESGQKEDTTSEQETGQKEGATSEQESGQKEGATSEQESGQKENTSSGQNSGETDKFDKDNGKTLDHIFSDCASIGEAVMGVSLKRMNQAYAVAKYAAKNRFTETSETVLTENFAKRYAELDSDGKESFDAAFDDVIIPVLDDVIVKGHLETYWGEFDDVGAAEKMEKLLLKKGLRESWGVIKKAYSGRK